MILELVTAAIFGLVQGVTEFLPISSSAHLLLLHQVLTSVNVDSLSFDAALHIGTLLALALYFGRDIAELSIAFFKAISKRSFIDNQSGKLALLILLGSIPAAVIGYFGESYIETTLRNAWIVVVTLIFGGMLFLLVEKFGKQNRDEKQLGVYDALFIGLAQALALIPGISRSGITIVAGMSRNVLRSSSARFSFLLSIPVVVGAGGKKLIELLHSELVTGDVASLILGILFAAISGIFAIKLLLAFTQKYTLKIFAYYRFALAVVVATILLLV